MEWSAQNLHMCAFVAYFFLHCLRKVEYFGTAENQKINVLTLKFMSRMWGKSSGANFGTFICQFHISTALSELTTPLPCPMDPK